MNQTIGIEFTVKGYEAVNRKLLAMQQSVTAFAGKVDKLNESLALLKTNLMFSGVSAHVAPMKEATAALADYAAVAERYNKATSKRNARAMDSTAAALHISPNKTRDMWEKSQRIAAQSVPPYAPPEKSKRGSGRPQSSGPQSAHRQDASGLPWVLGAAPYALRWGATAGAIYGGASFAKETLLGGSRQDLAKGLRDVGVLGFSVEEIDKLEKRADEFVKKFWVGGNKREYVDAFAEMGSAFDPNDSPYFKSVEQGRKTLQRMTEQAMVMGAATKMSSGKASELLGSVVQSQLAFMKADELEKYKKGIKDIGDLSEQTAAKISETVRVTAIWGTEIAQAFAYELPGAMQKGWSLDSLLAYTGMIKTAGIPASRAGRAMRMFMEKGPEDMAYLWFAGNADEETAAKFKGLPEKDRKKMAEAFAPTASKLFNADPFGFGRQLGAMLEKAEGRGFQLGKILDTDFTQIFRAFLSPEMLSRMEQVAKQIQDANLKKVESEAMKKAGDPGFFMQRIENAWTSMKDRLSLFADKSEKIPGLIDAVIKPLYSVIDWVEGQKGGEEVVMEVAALVGHVSWGIMQTIATPIRWLSNTLLGTDLKWVNFSEFQQAVDIFIIQFRYFWVRLENWMREGAKWLVGKLDETEAFVKASGVVIKKGLPIAPGTVPSDNFPKHTPDFFNNMFNNQLPPANMQPSHGQPIRIENNDKIQLESKIYLDFNQVGQAVQEYERRNEIQRGNSFGDYVGAYSGGY